LAGDTDAALPTSHHLLYLVGRAVPAAIGFLAIIAWSHLFDTATYGEYAVILGFANIVVGALLAWIRISMTRFCATPGPLASRMIGVALAIQSAASLALLLVLGTTALVLQSAAPLLVAFAALSMSWSDLNLDLLRARQAVARFSLQYLLRQVLTVVSVLVAMAIGSPWNPIVVGLIAGTLVSSLTLLPQLLPCPEYRFTREDVRVFAAYGIPLSFNYFLASLTLSLDRLIIAWLLGREAAGTYALAADIVVQLLGVIMDGVTLAFLPYAARTMDQRGKAAASGVLMENLLVLLGIGMPAALGLAVCGPGLGQLVLGGDFGAASQTLISLLALANLGRGLRVFFLENTFQVYGRTNSATLMTALAAILLAALAVPLLPVLGIVGGAIAALASSLVALALGLAMARVLLERSYPWVDLAKIAAASVACALAAALIVAVLPGPLGLASAILAGVATYAAALWLANPDDLRRRLRGALRAG
jgi:O-antigen/teichoic acid export membrane protein